VRIQRCGDNLRRTACAGAVHGRLLQRRTEVATLVCRTARGKRAPGGAGAGRMGEAVLRDVGAQT